jgi:hypothetical protein
MFTRHSVAVALVTRSDFQSREGERLEPDKLISS